MAKRYSTVAKDAVAGSKRQPRLLRELRAQDAQRVAAMADGVFLILGNLGERALKTKFLGHEAVSG